MKNLKRMFFFNIHEKCLYLNLYGTVCGTNINGALRILIEI